MKADKIFELIAMISQLKPLYPQDELYANDKMLRLISDLEQKLIEEINTDG